MRGVPLREGIEESFADQRILIDPCNVLSVRAPRSGIQRENLRKRAVVLEGSREIGWYVQEVSYRCGGLRQPKNLTQRPLTSPISDDNLNGTTSAEPRHISRQVVERCLEAPPRVAHVRVIARAENERQR